MKIFASEYQLGERKGALLKVVFADGLAGFSDCHPWPELGDPPLARQLKKLSQNITTCLTEKALKFARLDALARKNGDSLLKNLDIPKSHCLIMNLNRSTIKEIERALEEGFDTFKVKLGSRLDEELSILDPLMAIPQVKWRLDFNNRLKRSGDLKIKKEGIEFIEDPFPYDKRWHEFPFPIACDRQIDADEKSYHYKVFKPAVEDFKETAKPLVVTSYLGHPLGQAADAYVAGNLAKKYDVRVSGLLSHRVYPPSVFSEQLAASGPLWKSPEGTGFGFDGLLKTLNWVDI